MNLPNVMAFFWVGFAMDVLPRLVPQQVGSETSELWLTVMGVVMMVIGGSYLARMAWQTLPLEKLEKSQETLRAILREENPADSTRTAADGKTSVRG